MNEFKVVYETLYTSWDTSEDMCKLKEGIFSKITPASIKKSIN